MLSVIIPTLNEAAALPSTLHHAFQQQFHPSTEFIISDCRSHDGTTRLASELGARIVLDSGSRASAMNRGAQAARGQVLLFLHADCKVPAHFDRLVLEAIDRGCIGGAFDFNWSSHPLSKGVRREQLRLVRIFNRIRFRWTGNFYGDQGIFVTTETFHRLGRFPELGLMEDVRFSQKLKQSGRTAILQPAIKTSPRRFLARGVARQFAQDLSLLAADSFGMLPERQWNRYNQLNRAEKTVRQPAVPAEPTPDGPAAGDSLYHVPATPAGTLR